MGIVLGMNSIPISVHSKHKVSGWNLISVYSIHLLWVGHSHSIPTRYLGDTKQPLIEIDIEVIVFALGSYVFTYAFWQANTVYGALRALEVCNSLLLHLHTTSAYTQQRVAI